MTLDLDAVGIERLGIAGSVRDWAPAVEGLQDGGEVDLGAVRVLVTCPPELVHS